MRSMRIVGLGAIVLMASLARVYTAPPADGAGGPMLTGTVRSATGETLGGVPVSARAVGGTVTRSVYTDERGEYVFPAFEAPFAPGAYKVWAQAVGFARTDADVDLAQPGKKDLVLNTVKDFSNQLSGSEWLAALPDETHEDRRMKEIFRVNCTECHQPGLVLQNRLDEQGWVAMIEVMEKATYHGWPGPNGPVRSTIAYHKQELAKWLAKVRGPEPYPLKFKLHPRPSGEAARVVITEYDIPTAVGKQERTIQDGSIWTDGVMSGLHGTGGIHDVQIDDAGNAWLTDSVNNDHRTLVKIDVKTGAVKGFKVVAPNGRAQTSHGIGRDKNGIMWFDTGGMLGRVDPKTEQFEFYRTPFGSPTTTSGQIDIAPNGNVWMSARRGALMFNQQTKKFTFYPDKTIGDGQTYGATADANGNGWWTQFNMDNVVHADVKTGEVFEFPMRPPEKMEVVLTPADREFYHNIGGDRFSGTFARPGSQAPRRLGTDKNGTGVWVANWWGENLARIDTKTKKVTYHKVPLKANPYNTVIDKNHIVWTNLTSDDAVGRFDPKTEQWVVYKLPVVGAELRHIAFDDARGDVWVPYREADRAARLQFRTQAQIDALKKATGAQAAAR